MPYTRNTRIKKIEHKHSVEYIAEVEYKYPVLGTTRWERIDEVDISYLQITFVKGRPIPWSATTNCLEDGRSELEGLEWAKALIDEYHKLYDESEWKPKVSYIKYP